MAINSKHKGFSRKWVIDLKINEEVYSTHNIVMDVLKENPKARNSDNYLMYKVYEIVGNLYGINIEEMNVTRFFLHLKEYGFPSPETIRRTRQKIQADNPELCGCSVVECHRALNEEVFREYARGI